MNRRARRVFVALALIMAEPVMATECVVLLHGLGRSSWSMWRLQSALEGSGYAVWNESYPSTEQPIAKLSAVVGEAVAECRKSGPQRIHFVTHSMGGILMRAYLQDHDVPEAGRVVMLAPPNHGSEIADRYRDRWWFKWMTGPAGQQLGTAHDSLPNRLSPLKLEVGVIAGRSSSDPWFGGLFAGDHDGKVSVASAALPEMKELLVVASGHTFMMNSPRVIKQVKAFLQNGSFSNEPGHAE